MKVLVIGQGGREHALIRALSLSPSVTEIHALPGSDGIAQNALCHKLDWNNFEAVLTLCLRTEIDVVLVGPEDPLVAGLGSFLRERGILVVGPNQEAALLEGSKVFAKQFMQAAKIPTSPFAIVSSPEETLIAAQKFTPPYVLKADGLAAGKGVFICKTLEDLARDAKSIFVEKKLGRSGERAILEQFSPGWELSYLVLTNGLSFQRLPIAQDHKRLHDGDLGPNTGGMGTVAPLNVPEKILEQIDQRIVQPTLSEIQKRGWIYRGVIFFGIMMTDQGPSLLEFNCRFGDPETQSILPLIENDFGLVIKDLAQGHLQNLQFKNLAAACVVLAAPDYPQAPIKGVEIQGDPANSTHVGYWLHAGSKKEADGRWVTNGGRVLNAVGLGANVPEAIHQAYKLAQHVHWKGLQMRQDIGKRANKN